MNHLRRTEAEVTSPWDISQTSSGLAVATTPDLGPQGNRVMPYVETRTAQGVKSQDVFSRLVSDRVIFLGSDVDDQVANLLVAQLLHLESADPDRDITMYINSPGGSVYAGMAIYDTMQYIKPDVATICIGMAMSMGAFLLAGGAKGKRSTLPNSKILIHQPSSGFQGQATDIEIHAEEILKMKDRLTSSLAANCGQDFDTVYAACERDHFMDSAEAKAFGIVDHVINQNQLPALSPHYQGLRGGGNGNGGLVGQ